MSTVDAVLEELSSLGIRIAVDDFGSRYSSLGRLLQVPASDIKIAPAVINEIIDSPQARALVRAAREIADSIGLRVIADGARSLPHLLAAHDAGAHAAQGNAICPPLVASRIHADLVQRADHAAGGKKAQIIHIHPEFDPNAG